MAMFVSGVAGVRWRQRDETSLRPVAMAITVGVSVVLGVALLGYYNEALTGSFFVSGYESLHGSAHNPGFHIDPYGRDFTPSVALRDLAIRWRSLNKWLFMWPIPSLTLLGVWCLSYRKWKAADGLFVWWIVVQSFMYCFMWSAGQVQYGPRFLYEALPAVVILSARGAVILEEVFFTSPLRRLAFRTCVLSCGVWGFWHYVLIVRMLYA
jgi:hypothetical protein